jgi:hypothetical protein
MYYRYAEQFGCHPQDVPKVVTVQAWNRWLLWQKAQAAREIFDRSLRPGKKKPASQSDLKLMGWTMTKDKYGE